MIKTGHNDTIPCSDQVQSATELLYKQQFGKMVKMLLHFSSAIDPQNAENLVHDACTAALVQWRQQGIPANPESWLFRVCRNKALNHLKKNRHVPLSVEPYTTETDPIIHPPLIADEQLQLLFACAHPDLPPKTQLVLTLKYVVNLRVDAIAAVLGMQLDAVDKLLVRVRKKIKDEKLLFAAPSKQTISRRIPIVHKIIYCSFNEGYKSSGGAAIISKQLCEEALLLSHALLATPFCDSDTKALHALMLFNAARLDARASANGDLLDLENQNRQLWNPSLLALARDYLRQSQSPVVSTYHLEAAIASVHCSAPDFERTDWLLINGLYARLLSMYYNPFVELNQAIALYYAKEKEKAFQLLNNLRNHAFMHRYYLLNMTLGKFHLLEGNRTTAIEFLELAFQQTKSPQEKDFIRKMINSTEVVRQQTLWY